MDEDTLKKKCCRCGDKFPLTKQYFHAQAAKPDGFRAHCKTCGKKSKKRKIAREGFKWCTKCDNEFPATLDYFPKSSQVKSGLYSTCKDCTNKHHQEYIAQDREHWKQYEREFRRANPDKVAEYTRRDRERHSETIRKRQKRYRKHNPEKVRAWQKRYRRRLKERREQEPQWIERQLKKAQGLRYCPICDDWWPATSEYFYRTIAKRSGFNSYCKQCKDKYVKEKNYYPRYAEKMRVYNARYRKEHPDIVKAATARWRKNNPEKVRAYCHNYQARKRAVPGTYTTAQIKEQLKRQKYHCYYAACGFSKFKKVKENGEWKYNYVVEHTFPLSRVVGTGIPANDMSYLVLSCASCNNKKHNRFPHEWFEGGRLL